MKKLRSAHAAVLLHDGRVLVFGGLTFANGSQDVADSAEVYTPSANAFATVSHMYQHRTLHAASLLPDGRVLIVGGIGQYGQYITNAELFDPATNAFSMLPPMLHARKGATAVALCSGRVLIVGGSDAQGAVEESEIFVYDPIMAAMFD
jgi:N-acetylneuraminic acid mutarotase